MTGWLTRIRALMLLTVLLTLAGLAGAQDYGQQLAQQYGLYPDFATTLRVQVIGKRMALAANRPDISFQIFNHNDLNALALPDGRIYVTSRMATAVTDDELAFVLGHEVTHIEQKHSANQSSRATGGALLGAILVAVLGGDAGDIRTGADIMGGLTYGHYSRKDEHRADEGGVRLMTRAGYDPAKGADAMQRLIDKYGRGDAKTPILGWFASHPDTQNRKDRILELAAKLKENPPPPMEDPLGVRVTLDPSAAHANAWLPAYLSLLVPSATGGRALTILTGDMPLPPLPATVRDNPPPQEKGAKEKAEPLAPVTVVLPPAAPRYGLTISLRQVSAGGAETLAQGQGTAVEATLLWQDTQSGLGGMVTAVAQHKQATPWRAHEELANSDALAMLEDGKKSNIEGTLEAIALRRAVWAFAEVVEANGPVDHSAPVTIKFSNPNLRVNDYLAVVRKGQVVSMVRVTGIEKKNVTGSVLWGTHTWKRGDQYVMAE